MDSSPHIEYLQALVEGHKEMERTFYMLQRREQKIRVGLDQQIWALRTRGISNVPAAIPSPPPPVPPHPSPPSVYHRAAAGRHQDPSSGAVWEVQLAP
jgi:hypothetical protein